jgi:hypothetical protein
MNDAEVATMSVMTFTSDERMWNKKIAMTTRMMATISTTLVARVETESRINPLRS